MYDLALRSINIITECRCEFIFSCGFHIRNTAFAWQKKSFSVKATKLMKNIATDNERYIMAIPLE